MGTATPLQFGRDLQSYCAYAPRPSQVKYAATITDGNATSVTVPSSYASWIVSFRYYPNDVWIDTTGATAIIPVGATLAATTSELNPASLVLNGGTTISAITAQTAADLSIVMWPNLNG